ncbi:RNA methyltransferase [Mycobacterium sp.]|uniref:TrmH family RNA methyltransferase n=1 Tax=Mycobacterium sp. TaxID=1785 RepID=UPI002D5BBA01|nr:RNA methyltransferase [Mycobacterium sp.]HZA09886.1 RNA methyltransferase [Mycobacterium sp.]
MIAASKLHRRVARTKAGRFLVEGPNLVEAALRAGVVVELFVTESAAQRFDDLLAGAGVPIHPVTDRAAKALSDTVTPVGLVGVCAVDQPRLADVLAGEPTLVAVPVGISEPGNAGTLIRIADAIGADAVVLAGHAVDSYNGKCLRASAGSIFTIPVLTDPDPASVVDALMSSGLQVLAAAVDGEVDLDEALPVLTAPTAWLFGPEAHGLPSELAARATRRVRIPMRGGAESLNVAAAAAICLYQSARAQS